MRAAQINSYGGNEVIEINTNVKTPSLKTGQALVEVRAASLNPVDIAVRIGYLQKMLALSFPITLGGDFSGIVIQVGEGVTNLKIGDEIYGQAIVANGGSGSFANYLLANTANSALKPKSIDFIKSASLPLVGASAIQALEDHINIQVEQKILIHGGAGGIGSLAIQLAKLHNAYVAATVSGHAFEFVKNLGADQAIDYKTAFEEILKDFDAVFDTVGGEVTNKSFKVLKEGGILVTMIGQIDQALAKQHKVRAINQMTETNTKRLNRLAKLIDSGKIKAIVDKVYPLDQIKEAFDYLEKGHPKGKIVVTLQRR